MIRYHNEFLGTAALVVLLGCADEPGGGESEPAPRSDAVAPARPAPDATYERNLVFLGQEGDSAILVPWFISAQTGPDGVNRRARGWLGRGGSWDAFFDESWTTPSTRVPWRILPHGPLRLVVDLEDALDRLVYVEGPRQLEIAVGSPIVEWTGQRGESFRVFEGTVAISNRVLLGALLDMSRARRRTEAPPGDWAFLASGDSLLMVLEDPGGRSSAGAAGLTAWTRTPAAEAQWPSVVVEWADVRAFERARRDVPVAWRLSSSEGELSGALESAASYLVAGEGEGPLLPVDGLFSVQGTVRIGGAAYPVAGLFRHVQP